MQQEDIQWWLFKLLSRNCTSVEVEAFHSLDTLTKRQFWLGIDPETRTKVYNRIYGVWV